MSAAGGKKSDSLTSLTLSDGGRAGERRTKADVELDRALRALFYAMGRRDGKSISKNFRNVACGETTPWRMLVRRLREAKAVRYDRHNYPLAKQSVREIDRWVDRLYGQAQQHDTGEFRPAA